MCWPTVLFLTSCELLFIDLSFQFEGAYSILTDAEESGEVSTISLYNAIMLGYYREVNSWASVSSHCRHYIFGNVIESPGAHIGLLTAYLFSFS
jgi:hypothetical protein